MTRVCLTALRKRLANPEILALTAVLILGVLLRLVFLYEPFECDEGFYAHMAQVILRGGVLYRDTIDIKPPGIFYNYAGNHFCV